MCCQAGRHVGAQHVRGVEEDQNGEGSEGEGKKKTQDALDAYCVNLNKKARKATSTR